MKNKRGYTNMGRLSLPTFYVTTARQNRFRWFNLIAAHYHYFLLLQCLSGYERPMTKFFESKNTSFIEINNGDRHRVGINYYFLYSINIKYGLVKSEAEFVQLIKQKCSELNISNASNSFELMTALVPEKHSVKYTKEYYNYTFDSFKQLGYEKILFISGNGLSAELEPTIGNFAYASLSAAISNVLEARQSIFSYKKFIKLAIELINDYAELEEYT